MMYSSKQKKFGHYISLFKKLLSGTPVDMQQKKIQLFHLSLQITRLNNMK